jgi:hypothetical protein
MIKSLSTFPSIILFVFYISVNILAQNSSQQIPSGLVGHWTFNNISNLTQATVGNDLVLTGSQIAVTGPSDTSGAVRIGLGSYYTATHNISPNGDGSKVNKYTIILDVKIPETNKWYALYQTNISNTDDGDWFINPSGNIGIGATGYTGRSLKPNEWYRIAISVYNGTRHDYYIDGAKSLSGTPGTIDDRFALSSKVLFFSDENNEDNELDIADIKIFSRDLSDSEIAELGGYEHEVEPYKLESYPYLQSPTPTSIYVCWSYLGGNPVAEYGLTPTLGTQVIPETIPIEDGNISLNWYAAKLEGLTPSTTYYYKVKTDSTESEIYKFRTQPVDKDSTEHIRFVVYGDNRTDVDKFQEVTDSVKSKTMALYGEKIEEDINLVFNVGDIVTNGNNLSQYLPEYFNPSHSLSSWVPFMVSIGNHERESPHYYKFMKYEDFGGAEGEKYYSFRIGKVLFIGLNSNWQFHNDPQINWLNQILSTAQNDNTIEWIFAFCHHPGHSELWPDGNTDYVQNRIIPTLTKYSKVDMLTYGHSHNYERGTVIDGDAGLRLMLNGGAGSKLDRWEMYNNQTNYPEIQKTYDHYCYSIVDLDITKKFCEVTTYSLGNPEHPLENTIIDYFTRDKANQLPPQTPTITANFSNGDKESPIILKGSNYNGSYDLMSSQFQITEVKDNFDSLSLNIQRDFEDIYGTPVAPGYSPIDLNVGIDLTEYSLDKGSLKESTTYWTRVRYRDKNLQWSSWSDTISFTRNGITNVNNKNVLVTEYKLYNNYPNPFNPATTIQFDIPSRSFVNLSIFNSLGQLVAELENRELSAGHYSRLFTVSNLSSGIYYYKLKADNYIKIKKMTFIK